MNEIFNLGNQDNVPSEKSLPKKKLSEKQLQALEAGRLKREEKRKQKIEIEGFKEMKTNKVIQHKKQTNLLQEQEKIKKMIDVKQPPDNNMNEMKQKLKQYTIDTLSTIDDPVKFKATKKYLDDIYQLSDMNNIRTKLETDYKTINKK